MIKRPKIYLSLCFVSVALVAAWFFYPTGTTAANAANAALAEFQIEKMTCGSCVAKIETALSRLKGFESIDINLTSHRGRVVYDSSDLDSQTIADVITTAGYPARLRLELSPSEFIALQQEQEQLGQKYLARIGDRLLARADFEAQVQQRSGGAVASGQVDRLWKTVWQDVLQRELLLSAAEQNKIIVQEGEVDVRLEELRQGHQGLDELVVKRYGTMEAFRARIREDMIIHRNIEGHVYAGIEDPVQQQNLVDKWYAELQSNTEVIIFDQRLKLLSQSGGGCGSGGGCCSS